MTTASKVVQKIEDQLAWRGPTGRPQGHIVIERADMEVLVKWIKEAAQIEAASEGG